LLPLREIGFAWLLFRRITVAQGANLFDEVSRHDYFSPLSDSCHLTIHLLEVCHGEI